MIERVSLVTVSQNIRVMRYCVVRSVVVAGCRVREFLFIIESPIDSDATMVGFLLVNICSVSLSDPEN